MIKNYFKSAIRNILRQKLFSAINIIGLSISLAAFLILLYVINELGYNKNHRNRDQIYRLISHYQNANETYSSAMSPSALGSTVPWQIWCCC